MSDQQEAEAADDTDAEESEGLQAGDFIELAYTARTVEDGDLVDTTDQEVAEEEGVDTDEQEFAPRTIVLGEGHIFEPVEDDIIGKEVGDTGTVVVPAADAFGEYDESEVRTVSAEKIPEDDRYPGAHVDIEGQHGHVETIIGGRARVDFNHMLAGQDIEYQYEVIGEVTDRVEKAQGLLSMYFDVDLDMHIETDEVEEEVEVESEDEDAEPEFETETVEKETLYIEQSPQLQFNQQWMMGKQQILQQVMDQIDVDRVIVQEVIDGAGMGGMMGGMGGMMGGMGGGEEDLGDIEDALEDADVDADEIVDELDEE
ncbi:FKBP-type peptidyl-prolyl cis-trans isomerase [Halarchaeum nitratireducens]|uniref:peptidylprolyl isomerase n=1 Tax=Halarchaeum nitratireducens TaxID=489913 RepID=A0A830GA48_9EURY|nr:MULTISPECIES: peptidylprolyl isomerase [Halarchaeum]MBP2250574.1 FKBP-type peptidyl-prolyl cis-trans isomerase SlyD [Halarchaeum solikamskense]GGN15381.1 peptidylprolyl isomerase [Halarchaeum nitratireducens]